jgi:hypothetical protein
MQKNEKSLGGGEEAFAEGALGPGATEGTLGLFLLLARWPGRRFTRADDEATEASIEALFLLSQGWPRPYFSIGARMFRRDSLASAMEIGGGKEETLDELKRKKMMPRKEMLMTRLGFFTLVGRALFISTH